jgi:phage terminase small subunit
MMTASRESSPPAISLNPRHRTFALEYLRNGGRIGAASHAAGYKDRESGAKILRRPEVQAYIRTHMDAAFAREEMSVQELLGRIARIARTDVRKLFNEDGGHILPHELPEEIAMCVRGIETELKFDADGAPPTAVRKYRLADPMPALTTLAKIVGLIDGDRQDSDDLVTKLAAARRRLRERTIDITPKELS